MLRYLIKTLLQMNLFTDSLRHPSNGSDLFFNGSLPAFNSSLFDWGNFTGFNEMYFAGRYELIHQTGQTVGIQARSSMARQWADSLFSPLDPARPVRAGSSSSVAPGSLDVTFVSAAADAGAVATAGTLYSPRKRISDDRGGSEAADQTTCGVEQEVGGG
ncbi:hypothetical protein KUCAC02_003567 [Chaenocephalus aceratus]|uniref:Uncharacterized protein n=1 Tax=Chaenocephalus aceratus TaxID=36190 RepID=A0ACB9WLE0_CHAAC|nr:hypothetical protein KUCAC02_003567 [Chaenocephalus aceratus]